MLRSTWGTSPVLRAFFARDERGLERDEVLRVAGRRAAGGSLRRRGCGLTATARGNRSSLDEELPYLNYSTSQVPIPQVMTPFPVSGATRFLAPSHRATARAAVCLANDEEDHRRTDGWVQHECLPSFSAVTDARGPLKSGGFGATDGIEADCSICMPI